MATDAYLQGFEETLWIDSDIGFNPDDVERIRSRELPLCCALYPQKGRRSLAAHARGGTDKIVFGEQGGVVEMRYVGTGFLHVRRHVYETMIQQLKLPLCNARFGRLMYPFFLPLVIREHWTPQSVVSNATGTTVTDSFKPLPTPSHPTDTADTTHWYLAEDFAFCERASRCGFKIMADTTIRLFHYGSYGYTWEDAGFDRMRYSTLEFNLGDAEERGGSK